MNKDEAIRLLRFQKAKYESDNPHLEALRIAISTLQQQTCDDCISRKDTLEKFNKLYYDNKTVIQCAELVINGMPSVSISKAKKIVAETKKNRKILSNSQSGQ